MNRRGCRGFLIDQFYNKRLSFMNPLLLSRALGWFSLGVGAAEITVPGVLSRGLGLRGGPWLVAGFGVREVAAGLAVLAVPDSPAGPMARVLGDALNLAVLAPALAPSNRRQGAAEVAFVLVAGITVLDVFCAVSLARRRQRRAQTAERTYVGPDPRIAQGAGVWDD